MKLVRFMTSPQGRIGRIVMGLLLISVGLFVVKDTLGTVLAVVGLIPLSAGASDVCIAGYMLGYPFKGNDARAKLAEQAKSNPHV